MHKQLRLKPLKNNQMGSIFHLWVCFVGCDEFKMPGSRTRKENAAVSNDRRTLPRFFKQRRGRVARGLEREFLVCVASFFCESASNAVKRRDAADTKKKKNVPSWRENKRNGNDVFRRRRRDRLEKKQICRLGKAKSNDPGGGAECKYVANLCTL